MHHCPPGGRNFGVKFANWFSHKLAICSTTRGLLEETYPIFKDMGPVSIVDGTGFREFCQELEPSYCIPSCGTITNRIVQIYNSTSDKIKELLKDKDVALTTSLATESCVTVTAHWISDDSYFLQEKQQLLGLKTEKLINDCPTWWNSTYDMICWVSEQQATASDVIFEKKNCLEGTWPQAIGLSWKRGAQCMKCLSCGYLVMIPIHDGSMIQSLKIGRILSAFWVRLFLHWEYSE